MSHASVDSSAIIEMTKLILERVDQAREDSKAELESVRAEKAESQATMAAKLSEIEDMTRERLQPVIKEVLPVESLAALQVRLESLHTAGLLADEELFSLQDAIADHLEARSASGGCAVITASMLGGNPTAAAVHKMLTLSKGFSSDSALARQLKRKCVQ